MQAVQPKEKDGKPSFKLPTKPSTACSKTEPKSKDNLNGKKTSNAKFKPAFKKESVAPASKVKVPDLKKTEKSDPDVFKNEKAQRKDQVKMKATKKSEEKEGEKQVEKNKTEKKQKKEVMPIVSLTDEDYDAIFTAVLENVANMDMDAWEPKASSVKVPRVPKKKKYKITVGTKAASPKAATPKAASPKASQQSSQVNEEESDGSTSDSADEETNVSESMGTVDVTAGLDDDDDVEKEQAIDKDEFEFHASDKENEDTGEKKKTKMIKQKKHPEPPKKRKPEVDRRDQSKKRLKQTQSEKNTLNKKRKGTKDKKQAMLQREVATEGTWVQCCNCTCMKWRYLPDIPDPSTLPERWTCNMNTNTKYSSCDAEEEKYDEREHIFTKFTEGSVVWAKMTGYPWWPAMVEIDPDEDTYFLTAEQQDMIPKSFHVVFLDDKVSRGWVQAIHVKQFTSDGDEHVNLGKKGSNYTKELNTAKRNAMQALKYSIKERIELFGFAARYRGKWYSSATNDGANRPKPKSGSSRKRTVSSVRDPVVDEEEEELDDSTIDDVMENAESLLENVAEMLDSLESSVDDSDEDSDFSAEELVVVERKRSKRQKDNDDAGNSKKKQKTDKTDLTINNNENSNNDCAITPPIEVTDPRSPPAVHEMDETGDAKSTASTSLKLDQDIFTMELSGDEMSGEKISKDTKNCASIKSSKNKSVPTNVTQEKDSKIKKCKTTKKVVDAEKRKKENKVDSSMREGNVVEGTIVDSDNSENKNKKMTSKPEIATSETNAADYNQNYEHKAKTSTGITQESKSKKQKNEKKMNNSVSDTIQNKVENDSNAILGHKNEKVVNKIKKKGFSAPSKGQDSVQNNMGKTENGKTVHDTTDLKSSKSEDRDKNKTDISSVHTEKKSMNKLSKTKKGSTKSLGEKTKSTKINETTSTLEKSGDQKTTEGIDNCDFDVFEDEDEVPDVNVPDVNDSNADKCAPPSGDRKVEADSDAEFDLEEHSLYDGEADGAAKVQEREVVPAPAPVVVSYDDDDSDPFDMMEE